MIKMMNKSLAKLTKKEKDLIHSFLKNQKRRNFNGEKILF
jgi:hypothetical protein